ncbi:MAG: endonuclease/exonuclease/phosphatase family protein [Calditrichaceae bacterium]|nr:endonuclease/exonuclease/phosphatase family protein [Calditrichia bacterium]NUQ40002.1 endonuclease/exonuclease/phosphatase family protein [Calditrichaceae bacterium]
MPVSVKFIIISIFALLLTACSKKATDAVEELPKINIPRFGEENTLEIASWNIQTFPKSGQTVSDVKEIVLDLDADLYAVQEINNAFEFRNLLDSLNAAAGADMYDGRLNELSSSFKTGIIFKKSVIEVLDSTYLFVNDLYDFASRPPFQLSLLASKNGRTFDFNLIVVHLKAEDGNPQSQVRRRNSIQKLENYIDSQLQSGSDPDFVVAGDWNDELEDPPSSNVFLPFLEDTLRYKFLTLPFAGSSSEFSYLLGGFNSLIDHILITTSIDTAYLPLTTQVLKLDQYYSLYVSEVSDHRPVAARFGTF